MKNLLKCKILSILTIVIILIASIVPSCFAKEMSTTIEEKEYTLNIPDDWLEYYYYINIFKNQYGGYGYWFALSTKEWYTNVEYSSDGSISSTSIYTYGSYLYGFFSGGGSSSTIQKCINTVQERINNCTFYTDESHLNPSGKLISNGYGIDAFTGANYISNYDISTLDGDLVFHPEPVFHAPFFLTSKEELESGKFESLRINSGDFNTYDNEEFYLFSYYYSGDVDDVASIYPRHEILLNGVNSNYFVGANSNGNYIYEIPFSQLGIDLVEGKKYGFKLASKNSDGVVTDYWESVVFTIGVVSAEDVTNNKLDEQTDAIKENTETNKGIWETIKDILSYINPFSENFFVYKLLELLGDLLKSLFVPSEDFLSQWFTDVSDYFEDAFGILYYPIDLVIQVLGRFGDIQGQEPVISFGNLSLFGTVLIPAYSYNFNDLLSNETISMVHNFYLITIDVILWFGLLVYCKNVIANIFGGKFTDDVIDEIQDPGGANKSYANYSKYQENKKKYRQEHGGN